LFRIKANHKAASCSYGRSSSSKAQRVGMSVAAHRHCARCLCGGTGRCGQSALRSIARLVIKVERLRGTNQQPLKSALLTPRDTCYALVRGGSFWASTLFDRIEHRRPSVARVIVYGKKPRPFAIRSQAWSGAGLWVIMRVHAYVLPMRRASAKRHYFRRRGETALCGRRRICSPVGFGVRSKLGTHVLIDCTADSHCAAAARSGITTCASS
jgi:hypothetical protein